MGAVDFDDDGERHAAQLFKRALDVVDVVALDPRFDEIRVRRQHDKAVAGSLGMQHGEERVDLRGDDSLVTLDAAAHLRPDLLNFLAVHMMFPVAFAVWPSFVYGAAVTAVAPFACRRR